MRLVINKRRSPTGDAAAPHRRPRASPSAETPKGAPSAELQATPSRGRRPSAHTSTEKSTAEPLNFLSHKSNENMKLVCGTKSAAGSGAVPADPLGIGFRFSPSRARFRYTFAYFSSLLSDIARRYIRCSASFSSCHSTVFALAKTPGDIVPSSFPSLYTLKSSKRIYFLSSPSRKRQTISLLSISVFFHKSTR